MQEIVIRVKLYPGQKNEETIVPTKKTRIKVNDKYVHFQDVNIVRSNGFYDIIKKYHNAPYEADYLDTSLKHEIVCPVCGDIRRSRYDNLLFRDNPNKNGDIAYFCKKSSCSTECTLPSSEVEKIKKDTQRVDKIIKDFYDSLD